MKKLMNKRLADYTTKDMLVIAGISILATPVIVAASFLPFMVKGKVNDCKEKWKEEKDLKNKNEAWFEEMEEEP